MGQLRAGPAHHCAGELKPSQYCRPTGPTALRRSNRRRQSQGSRSLCNSRVDQSRSPAAWIPKANQACSSSSSARSSWTPSSAAHRCM